MDVHFLNVSKKIGSNQILSKINFKVYSGETLWIVGASNSGKTCLIRILLNIYKASEGFVYFDGVEVSAQMFNEKRKDIAYIPQGLNFYENMTVFENLLFYDGIYFPRSKMSARIHRIKNILELLNLQNESKNPVVNFDKKILSKIKLAQMRHFNHGLVIVDEPFFQNELEEETLLIECLKRFQHQGTTVIMTSKSEIESSEVNLSSICYMKAGGRIE